MDLCGFLRVEMKIQGPSGKMLWSLRLLRGTHPKVKSEWEMSRP